MKNLPLFLNMLPATFYLSVPYNLSSLSPNIVENSSNHHGRNVVFLVEIVSLVFCFASKDFDSVKSLGFTRNDRV